MCGIVGYVGEKSAVGIIVDGLKKLEYRGYDSAGVAILQDGTLQVRRAAGRMTNLEAVLRDKPVAGTLGIGHTRWATHGRPSEENAHPHTDCSGSLVVVHNGILENYLTLKERLQAEGHVFTSETDTEVLAHLIEHHLAATGDLERAVRKRPRRGARRLRRRRGVRRRAGPARGRQGRRGQRRGRDRAGRDDHRLRHPGHPRPHAGRGDPRGRRDGGGHRARRAGLDRRAASGSSASRCGSSGIRSWPRRAATGTSCSRRSTSSRARSPTRSGAASRRTAGRWSCPKWGSTPRRSAASSASCSWPAAPRTTPPC